MGNSSEDLSISSGVSDWWEGRTLARSASVVSHVVYYFAYCSTCVNHETFARL